MVSRRPRSHALQFLGNEVLDAVAAGFDLGRVRSARARVAHGSDAYSLSNRGATAAKLVLACERATVFVKRVPWYVGDADLELGLRLQDATCAAGMPVPRIHRTPTGDRVLRLDQERFVVTDFLPSASYDGSLAGCTAMAAALGELHLASRAAGLDTSHAASARGTVRDHALLLEEVHGTDVADILGALDILPEGPTEPLLAVHGDFIPWNLGFEGDRVVGIYDFDSACVDSRLHDLAEALVSCFLLVFRGRNARLAEPGWLLGSTEGARRFVYAYETASWPLGAPERDVLWRRVLANLWECLLLACVRGELRWDRHATRASEVDSVRAWTAQALGEA